jgi:nucleoside phosphorylase
LTGEFLTAPGLQAHVFLTAGSQDARDSWLLRAEARGWPATAWADRGILGLTVMITPLGGADCPAADCPGAWADLEHAWEAATADLALEGVLGEARIFLALHTRPSGEAPTRKPHDTVPVSSRDRTAGEILVCEIEPESGDERIVRRLAAVATAAPERQPGPSPWTNGDGTLTLLARHLMHAARLHEQIRVFDEDRRSRQLRDDLSLLAGGLSGEPAERDPVRLRRAHAQAIALRAELDAMRHVTRTVADDLREALDLSVSGTEPGPLGQDRHLATWFGQRLDDEITSLDAAVRNAQPALRLLAGQAQLPGRGEAHPAPRGTSSGHPSSPEPWAVVFTALGVEYQAIRAYLAGPVRQHEERGTLYEVGTLPGAHGDWHIALTQTGPGSTTAALQFDRAVRVFAPEIALFLGVAGGRRDVALGDVVAADMIYDYEWGKSTLEGFEPRIRVHYPAHRLLQRAQLVARENQWQQRIRPSWPGRPPASFVKPIVTGGKVIAHHKSAAALLIDQYIGDALAVETEGHGFLAAAYVNPGVDALVIRGISDLLAGKDQDSDDYWQPVASANAAAFAVELLHSIGSNRS